MTPRELDAEVARVVMGLKVIGLRRVLHLHDGGELVLEEDDQKNESETMEPCYEEAPFGEMVGAEGSGYKVMSMVPYYSTSGDGMLAVIEAMRGKGYAVTMCGPDLLPESWAEFCALEGKMAAYEADAASLPRAVSLAAVRAVGG